MTFRFLLLIAVCVASCSDNKKIPKDILPPEKMQAVYWDYIQADAYANQFVRRDTSQVLDSSSAALQSQIFAFHKISKADFYRSYNFYVDDKDLMKALLDTIIARQNARTALKNDSLLQPKKDSTGIFPSRKTADTIKAAE